MKTVLLDTNFIITYIKQKIDFFEELYLEGYQIIIPDSDIKEIDKLNQSSALTLLKKNNFKKINPLGKNVDNSIIKYARENPDVVIATLDKEIQKKIKNKKMIIRNRKKLEIL